MCVDTFAWCAADPTMPRTSEPVHHPLTLALYNRAPETQVPWGHSVDVYGKGSTAHSAVTAALALFVTANQLSPERIVAGECTHHFCLHPPTPSLN